MPARQPGTLEVPVPPTHDLADEPESPRRAALALVITCLLLVIIPAMVVLIGYRSVMAHGPTTAIVVGGDPSLEGATIVVTETTPPHRQWTTSISKDNDWQTPILVDPGPYHVIVTHEGREILNTGCTPDRMNGVRFDLPTLVTVVGDAALSRGRLEIVRTGPETPPSRLMPLALKAQDHYREPVYLAAGDYRAIVRSTDDPAHIMAQAEFKVDRTGPVRVDLTRVAASDQ